MSLARRRRDPRSLLRRRRHWLAAGVFGLIAALAMLLAPDEAVHAQSISAPGTQTITHSGADAQQVFSEVAWDLISGADALGYTAQWNCGPFQHTGDATFKSDCKLQIRILASGGSANWAVAIASDQTNIGGGDLTAVVAAQSSAVGDGQVGLIVTFVDTDFSKLAGGSYSMTVTGTITAN